MTDISKANESSPVEPTYSEKLRIRQAEALKRQQALEERKHADALEEHRLRFAAQRIEVDALPNGKKIEEKISGMSEEMDLLCDEIDFNEPDQGHSVHLREALEALIKNYKNGLARFKALPFLENEDMLMGCVGELMESRIECREIIEDLEQLFDLVYIKQATHVWYQEIKKDCENLYHGRTSRDLLFRNWLRGFVERDEVKEKEGGLQKMIEEAFGSQELEMPDDYRIKSKEEREKEHEELRRREEAARKEQEAEAAKKGDATQAGDERKADTDKAVDGEADTDMKTAESKA